uniref:Nuclear transcription factor Y subunit gamma n=1 Tax=Lygus hesperus TaxID=30085 RepID=A0A0A9XAJ5_LYGHE
MSVYIINEDNECEDEPSPTGQASGSSLPMTEASQALVHFWPRVTKEINNIQNLDVRSQALPLARIKKIMKLDEEVKMISGEAPVLFAKAAELFIQELTLRSWVHTEDNKRRTLQRNDIAMAVTKYDQFDFLIDIVPRDEAKPQPNNWRSSMSADQVHYYFQLNQQQQQAQQALQAQEVSTAVQQQQVIAQPIQTISAEEAKPSLSNANIQLVQQVVSPTGEIQQIPVQLTQNQLNMIRMQLGAANGAATQPIIIQPQIIQVTQSTTSGTPVYIQTTNAQSNS